MYDLITRISDLVGIVGVILTLIAYYLLNVNRIQSTSMLYLLFNLIGSCFLLFSLMFHWNLASVCIEIAWISISLIGIYRALKARVENPPRPNNLYMIRPVQETAE